MTNLDDQIKEALDAEDRALFEEFGEQGLFAQAFGVYHGKFRWIAVIASAVMFVMTAGAFYAIWMFVQAGEGALALRWGGVAWILMTMVGFMKVWFWMRMESNRVIREIKRVELQVAQLQAKQIV